MIVSIALLHSQVVYFLSLILATERYLIYSKEENAYFRYYWAILWTKPHIVDDTMLPSNVGCIP